MSGRGRPVGGRAAALAAAAYLGIAALFLRTQVLGRTPNAEHSGVGDLLGYYYPMLRHGFARLARGEVPLWNPYQSCGSPFLAIPQLGFLYPLYAPFLVLDAARAIDLDIVLHLTLGALGACLLCRHFGLRWGPALLGGVVYAYQSSAMLALYFADFLPPLGWAPWIVLSADRVLVRRSWRRVGLLAAVIAVTFLGGNVQFAYLLAWAVLPLVVIRCLGLVREEGVGGAGRALVMLGVAAVLAVGLDLVRVLPAAEYTATTWRPPGGLTLDDAGIMAVLPRAFLQDLFTPASAGGLDTTWLATGLRRQAYVGILPLALALVGLCCARERAAALAMAAAALWAALYAFGTHAFLFPVLFHLPAGSWFRGPDRGLFILGLGVGVLCAGGVDAALAGTAAGKRSAGIWVVALGAVLGLGLVFGDREGRVLLAVYGAVGLLALLALRARVPAVRVAGVAALVAVVLGDLIHARPHRGALPSQVPDYFTRHAALFADIRARQGFDRTYVWASFRPPGVLRFHHDVAKAGLNHGVWLATDYEPLAGRRLDRYLARLGPGFPISYRRLQLTRDNLPLLRLMGVRFLVLEDALDARLVAPDVLAEWRRIVARDGVSVYEDPGAMPRAFVVPGIEVERDEARLLDRLARVDLRAVALVEEDVPELAPGEAGGSATIVAYAPERVVIEASAARGGLLVLTDQYDPGWRARIDGAPARLLRADYLFRGVPLPPGRHTVEMTYRPASFAVGAAGSLVALAVTVLLLWRGR